MKRILLYVYVLCSVFLFCGCTVQDKEVKVGDYYMETDFDVPPCIMISEEQIVFTYDFLSSKLTMGTYVVEGDVLTMTTYDGDGKYVFKIEKDSLIFQESKSSALTYVEKDPMIKVLDGAKFVLGEWEPESF